MFEKNDEVKRNQLWRAVVTVSSVLIVIIAAFFIIKMFTANPLEGKWIYEDSNLAMTIKGNGTAVIEWPDEFEGADVAVEMSYSIDMDTKTFSLHMNDEAVEKAAEASGGAVTAEGLNSAVGSLEATYSYNMEQNQLTLTDREYGEQLVFDKE